MILIIRFEFTYRAFLLCPTSENKYTPAVKLGPITGMARKQFDRKYGVKYGGVINLMRGKKICLTQNINGY